MSPKLSLGFPHGWQGPTDMSQHLLPVIRLLCHQQELGLTRSFDVESGHPKWPNRQEARESNNEERSLPSAGSIPRWLDQSRSQEYLLGFHVGCSGSSFGPSFTAYPGTLTRNWIKSGTAKTWSCAHMECWCLGGSFGCYATGQLPQPLPQELPGRPALLSESVVSLWVLWGA